ncbi:NADH-quinone oxidoreductase subunit NuoG [Solimonas marina]|uniref:NADH-quinone oxidoreductase n=1 Tax=Solimonas marina TaxID=2714601 RepID=A0A970B5X3_9GAMM|nr:NADH-quinone oxidoreductase subunit NuoG [Solimonas marina]NKF22178.1 NADH-quinone oxidoreductase subunit NuoG [Solimonas marina]
MATIHVDGKQYDVDGADNLLQACLNLGLDIPYFCWHPALGSVGACRQCAVKSFRDENDKMGRIVMSCMTPASNGTYISIDDEEAKAFRATIVEFLMTNHPHDCPVCEEGGHCHLQDMTVMTQHHSRSYRFTKRTHLNQDLGPFIGHEMNRCISCYRCVRYYKDYAGGTDLGVYGSAANVYFGRAEEGTLESEFSGNLTEVCPTGVFTDKTHSERYTRKWDMQYAPSICASCSVGCNVSPGERYGEIRRVENRYHGELNGYFLCDRGRFGYGYTNLKDRPRHPLIDGATVTSDVALGAARGMINGASKVIAIGSPRASVEANYALRTMVGAASFYDGHATQEGELVKLALQIVRDGPVPATTITAMEDADAVLVLGEDITATAPRMALAVRQAARGKGRALADEKKVSDWQAISLADLLQRDSYPVFVASVDSTRLDDIAHATVRAAPEDLARLGFAVANLLDASSPAVAGLDEATAAQAKAIADALAAAKKPLIISGTGAGSTAVMQAAANIAWALKAKNDATGLALTLPEANSYGLAMLEPQPLADALEALASGAADTLVVLENDLYRRAPKAVVDAALAKVKSLIVIDHTATDATARAQVVLPAATVFEGDGTVVNYEGRAQRHFQVYDPKYYDASLAQVESWRWLAVLEAASGWKILDDITGACATAVSGLAGIVDAAPGAAFRIDGLKIAREPHRYSGRTAMRANQAVSEIRQPVDPDTPLSFSMEGYNGVGGLDRPAALMPYAWAPGWNSPQSWNKFQQEIGGHLRGGDPGKLLFAGGATQAYFTDVPAAFTPSGSGSGFRVLPLHLHFGGDELSSRAEPIRERASTAFVAIARADVARAGVNGHATVSVDGELVQLPTFISDTLPAGTVGLPAGFAGVPFVAYGVDATVSGG